MNAALRVLRNELAWLADADRRAKSAALIDAEKTSPALTIRYRLQIMRERREIEDAIESIEAAEENESIPGPLVALWKQERAA